MPDSSMPGSWRRALPCLGFSSGAQENTAPFVSVDESLADALIPESEVSIRRLRLGTEVDDAIVALERSCLAVQALTLPVRCREACSQIADGLRNLQRELLSIKPICKSHVQISRSFPDASSVLSRSSSEPALHASSKRSAQFESVYNASCSDGSYSEGNPGPADGITRETSCHRICRTNTSFFRKRGLSTDQLSPAMDAYAKAIWPRIGAWVDGLLHDRIEPLINESLPGLLKGGVKFGKVTLGDSSPTFGPVFVETDQLGNIELHASVHLSAPDAEVWLEAMGIHIGIRRLTIDGEIVVIFGPTKAGPPWWGGLQVFFANPPNLGMEFVGAGKLAYVPGLRSSVRNAITGAIGGVMVLPRRIAVDLDREDGVDVIDLKFPEPVGVLRMTLWRGDDFVRRSDPYVVATLGLKTWSSPHVRRTARPLWGGAGQGLCVDFPIHNNSQVLSLTVYDHDFSYIDDLVGAAKPINVADLTAQSEKIDVPLLTRDGMSSSGKLVISAEFVALQEGKMARANQVMRPGLSIAHFSMKLTDVCGLPPNAEWPFKLKLRVFEGSRSNTPREVLTARNSETRRAHSAGAGLDRSDAKPRRWFTRRVISTSALLDPGVTAEATTTNSWPKPQLQLAQALESVIRFHHDRGMSEYEIADMLQVDQPQVHGVLNPPADKVEAEKRRRQIAMERAATSPCFNQVLQLLLPEVEEHCVVELMIMDKHKQGLGTARFSMQHILSSESLRFNGPFRFDTGAEVSGSAWLRWLEQ